MDESFENWGNRFVSIPDIIKCNSANDIVTNSNLNCNENCPVTEQQTDYQNDKTVVDIENSITDFPSMSELDNTEQNINENKEFHLFENKINGTEERSLDSQDPSIDTNLLASENVCIPSLFQSDSEINSMFMHDVGNEIDSCHSLRSPNSEPKGFSVNNVAASNNGDDLNTTSSTLSLFINDNEYSPSLSDGDDKENLMQVDNIVNECLPSLSQSNDKKNLNHVDNINNEENHNEHPLSLSQSDKENLMLVDNIDDEVNDNEGVESLFSEKKCVSSKDHKTSDDDNDLKNISPTQSLSPNDNEAKLIDENILKDASLPLIAPSNEMIEKKEKNVQCSDDEIIDLTVDSSSNKTSSLGDRRLHSFTLRNKKKNNVNENGTKKRKRKLLKVQFLLPPKRIKKTSENASSAKLPIKDSIKKSVNGTLVKNEVTKRKPRLSSCSQVYYQRIIIEEAKVIAKVNQRLTDIRTSFINGSVNLLNAKFILDRLYTVLKKIEANQIQQIINEPVLSSKSHFLKKASFLQSTMTFHQSLSFKVSKHRIQKTGPRRKSSRSEEISKSKMPHQNGLSTLQGYTKYLQQNVPSNYMTGLSSRFSNGPIVADPNIRPAIPINRLLNSGQKFENASYINQIQNSFENSLASSTYHWNHGIPLENDAKHDFFKHLGLNRFQNVDTLSDILYDHQYSDNNYPISHGNHAEWNVAYTQSSLHTQNPSKVLVDGTQDYTMNNTGSRTFSSAAYPPMPEINQAQHSFYQIPRAHNTMLSMDRDYSAMLSYQNNTAMNHPQFDIGKAHILESNTNNAATPSNSTAFLNHHLPSQLPKYKMPTVVRSTQQFSIPERTLSGNDKVLNWICTQSHPTSKKFQNAASSKSCINSKTIIADSKHKVNTRITPAIPSMEKNYPETITPRYVSKDIEDFVPYSSLVAVNVGNENNERAFTSEVQTVAKDLTVQKNRSSNGVTSSCSALSEKPANVHNMPLEKNIPVIVLVNKTAGSIKPVETKSKFQIPFAKVSKCVGVNLKAKAVPEDDTIVFPSIGSTEKTITSQTLTATKSGKRKPRKTSTKKKSASQNSQASVENLHDPDTQVPFSTHLDHKNNPELKSKVSIEKYPDTSVKANAVHVHASNMPSVVSSSSFSDNFNKQPPAVSLPNTLSPINLPTDTVLTIIPLLQNEEQQHSSNVLKDISNNSMPEPVLNEFELPSVIELIKAGIIPFGDNILSIVAPDGLKCATLDYSGFIVNADGLIFNTIVEWCQYIASSSSLDTPLSMKACYKKVFYNGKSLMSICLSNPTQEKATTNSVTDVNDAANQIVPFSYFDGNKYPNFQNLSKMMIFPIGDDEIGPLSPRSQWGNVDKWE